MSFWLDDDDDNENANPWQSQDDPFSSSARKASTTSATTNVQQSQSQNSQVKKPPTQQPKSQLYQCNNCGSNESYYDDATGTDVCTLCFTQSQVLASTQQNQSNNETDWDDVIGLAARTAGGYMKQHKISATGTKSSQIDEDGNRIPLQRRRRIRKEETYEDMFDTAIPLPNVQICLQGMKCILQRCVTIVVYDILSQRKCWSTAADTKQNSKSSTKYDRDDDDDNEESDYYEERQRDEIQATSRQQILYDSLLATVKQIWISYLHAWYTGAEYYGTRFPHVRFCFRDFFITDMHLGYMVRRYIPHRIINEIGPIIPDVTQSNTNQHRLHDEIGQSDDDDELQSNDEAEDITGADRINELDDEDDIDNMNINTKNPKLSTTSTKTTKQYSLTRCTAIKKLLQKYGPPGRKKGYKEVALLLQPSMAMVAAIIHLALTKLPNIHHNEIITATAGITYIDVCDWVRTGKLPLMTAYHRLLTLDLQQKLYTVRSFFGGYNGNYSNINPLQLEIISTQLCIACRIHIVPNIIINRSMNDIRTNEDNNADHLPTVFPAVVQSNNTLKGDAVREWEMSHLPYILARFVARAGLNQDVLDNSLRLIGYAMTDHHTNETLQIPIIKPADQLSRIDELLAIIAIACQLDPQWRNWMFLSNDDTSAVAPSIPWCDSEIPTVRNGPTYRQYLNFVNQHLLPENDDQQNFHVNQNVSLLPAQYISAMRSISDTLATKPTCTSTASDVSKVVNDNPKLVIRPCRVLLGAAPPQTVDLTNLKKRNPGRLKIYDGPRDPKKRVPVREDEKIQRNLKRIQFRRFQRNECDQMFIVPYHDFYKLDRCNNDWEFSGDIDTDQMRLIQYIADVFQMDPSIVLRSMNLLLRPPKRT